MNGEIDERVFKEVCKHIDFNNDENNIKARDNKKGVYKRRIFKNDKYDLLSQLTLLFYSKICIGNNDNNINRDEIIALKNENEKLKLEMEILKRDNRDFDRELKECYTSIDNLYDENLKIKDKYMIRDTPNIKPDIDDKPSFFDDECNEPVVNNIDLNYNPYNQKLELFKPSLSDYDFNVIDQARNYKSISYNEWHQYSDDDKLTAVIEYMKYK